MSADAIFTWTDSLARNPLATLKNVVEGAFDEALHGLSGLASSEVKKSCFSFGHRINTVAPYTALFPGGVFGSILSSLARSYMIVFNPLLASFKGIFALMIGIICKTGVSGAALKIINAIANLKRRGMRFVAMLFRRFGK